jgi:5-methyltetrahydrofolate--homocysteine methyltransferase
MKKAVAILQPYIEAEHQEGAKKLGKILLATVKGDVHDIGKNIVGVVLACNNFEIIDLGVMVPAEKILDEAQRHHVDIIGLSGLITPSLDEMVFVAKEMERRGMNVPLLIGGATTSKIHTAVKIDPAYSSGVIYVLDASRSVPIATQLLNKEDAIGLKENIKEEYAILRDKHLHRNVSKEYLSLVEARSNKTKLDWKKYAPPAPKLLGVQVFEDLDLRILEKYIDWTPFFQTWELHGKFPKILEDKIVGTEAKKLYADALHMLDKIIQEKWLQAKAVIGFFPANSIEDDIQINAYNQKITLHHLRQQNKKAESLPNFCLADFVAPADTGIQDYIGAFAVTAGIGIERKLSEFESQHDDYSAILLKALADRLAEALAEYMHEQVRTEYWGYAADEVLDNQALIQEKYIGIRPAPGYPACPDHTEKATLFNMLEVEKNIGITLTESMAMYPTASVSGWYFSHPESRYFGLGKIGKDQIEDYALRKGMTVESIERWLGSVLNYM